MPSIPREGNRVTIVISWIWELAPRAARLITHFYNANSSHHLSALRRCCSLLLVFEQIPIRRRHARFTIACGACNSSLFAYFPHLERLILVGKGSQERFPLWLNLIAHCWDTAIDPRGSNVALLLMSRRWKFIEGDRAARQNDRATTMTRQ